MRVARPLAIQSQLRRGLLRLWSSNVDSLATNTSFAKRRLTATCCRSSSSSNNVPVIATAPKQNLQQQRYDLVVIGGGSGGVASARRAAALGAHVALIDEGASVGGHQGLGGTCVKAGCIPKKLYKYGSEYGHHLQDAKSYGWDAGQPSRLNLGTLRDNKDKEIARLEQIYEGLLTESGVALHANRHARLLLPQKIAGATEATASMRHLSPPPFSIALQDSSDGSQHSTIMADRVVLATGSWPFVPDALNNVAITSNEVFALQTLPESVVLVGGGYIGVELAHFFRASGTPNVTMVVRGAAVLRGFDRTLRAEVQQNLENAGIDVLTHSIVEHARSHDDNAGCTLTVARGEDSAARSTMEISTDVLVCATGRRPLTHRLTEGGSLENIGIAVDPKTGAIVVDDYNETTVPGIFAVGDCVNRVSLTPWAIAEGRALADRLFGKRTAPFDASAVLPTAVFSQPEAATVGLTEQQAVALHGQRGVRVYETRFRPLKDTLTGRTAAHTVMKLVVHDKSDVVLGAHAVGEGVAEMVQCLAVAVSAHARKQDFDDTIALHPTSAEEWVLMSEMSLRTAVATDD